MIIGLSDNSLSQHLTSRPKQSGVEGPWRSDSTCPASSIHLYFESRTHRDPSTPMTPLGKSNLRLNHLETCRRVYSSFSPNPSMSITSLIAESATCFFDPLPRCDFGFRFFFTFGRAASRRRACHVAHVHVFGCLLSVRWWRSFMPEILVEVFYLRNVTVAKVTPYDIEYSVL